MNSLSQSALSQHLGRLRRTNVVRTRRKSQTIYYSIDDTDVLRLLRLLEPIHTDERTMQRNKH
jgi:DNA-binding transcriptional ArsR family regulator